MSWKAATLAPCPAGTRLHLGPTCGCFAMGGMRKASSVSALPSRPSSWLLACHAGLWAWTLSWKAHRASGLTLAEGNSLGGGTGRHARQPTLPSVTSSQVGRRALAALIPSQPGVTPLTFLHLFNASLLSVFPDWSRGLCTFHRLFGPRAGWG